MKEKYTHEEIARLAYELWERRGRPLGSPEILWRKADTRELVESRATLALVPHKLGGPFCAPIAEPSSLENH